MFPDWVNKFKTKSSTIKKIGNNYYLYKATSYYDSSSKKPVSIQEYIGKITADGVQTKKILLDLSEVEVVPLNSIYTSTTYNLNNIYLLKFKSEYYFSKLSKQQLKIVKELQLYDNGKFIF